MRTDWAPVREWHRAVNEKDVPAALAVAAEAIVMGGPKGQAAGVASLAEWVASAGIHLRPVAWHPVDGSTVVVEQDATWPRVPQAEQDAAPVRLATLFRLRGDRITAVLRYDGPDAAMAAATGTGAELNRTPLSGS